MSRREALPAIGWRSFIMIAVALLVGGWMSMQLGTASAQSPVAYEGEATNGVTGTVGGFSGYYPEEWDYWFFCVEAGQDVRIDLRRLEGGLDPGMSLFRGTTDSTEGLSYYEGGPDMTFIDDPDDEIPANVPGPYEDSRFEDYLPAGLYTLAVYGWASDDEILYGYRIDVTGTTPCGDVGVVENPENFFPPHDPTPTPTPTATPTLTATPDSGCPSPQVPHGQWSTPPVASGLTIAFWGGGNVSEFPPPIATSYWTTVGGDWFGYVPGAPAFVNKAFLMQYPGGAVPPCTGFVIARR